MNAKRVYIKLDISNESNFSMVIDIKHLICNILDIYPHTLRLLSIKKGCLVVAFLIPAHIVNTFMERVSRQKEEFKGLSALWVKCNSIKIYFRDHVSLSSPPSLLLPSPSSSISSYSLSSSSSSSSEEENLGGMFVYLMLSCNSYYTKLIID